MDGLSEIAEPLFELSKRAKGVKIDWKWEEEEQQAFESLKRKLAAPPVLATLRKGAGVFILDVDCSERALGGILSRKGCTDDLVYVKRKRVEPGSNEILCDEEGNIGGIRMH